MAKWHHGRCGDLGLRAVGLLLCGMAYLAIHRLCAVQVGAQAWGTAAFALATLGFSGASAGSALLALGHHLLEPVEVGVRWRARPDPAFGLRHKEELPEPAVASITLPPARTGVWLRDVDDADVVPRHQHLATEPQAPGLSG